MAMIFLVYPSEALKCLYFVRLEGFRHPLRRTKQFQMVLFDLIFLSFRLLAGCPPPSTLLAVPKRRVHAPRSELA